MSAIQELRRRFPKASAAIPDDATFFRAVQAVHAQGRVDLPPAPTDSFATHPNMSTPASSTGGPDTEPTANNLWSGLVDMKNKAATATARYAAGLVVDPVMAAARTGLNPMRPDVGQFTQAAVTHPGHTAMDVAMLALTGAGAKGLGTKPAVAEAEPMFVRPPKAVRPPVREGPPAEPMTTSVGRAESRYMAMLPQRMQERAKQRAAERWIARAEKVRTMTGVEAPEPRAGGAITRNYDPHDPGVLAEALTQMELDPTYPGYPGAENPLYAGPPPRLGTPRPSAGVPLDDPSRVWSTPVRLLPPGPQRLLAERAGGAFPQGPGYKPKLGDAIQLKDTWENGVVTSRVKDGRVQVRVGKASRTLPVDAVEPRLSPQERFDILRRRGVSPGPRGPAPTAPIPEAPGPTAAGMETEGPAPPTMAPEPDITGQMRQVRSADLPRTRTQRVDPQDFAPKRTGPSFSSQGDIEARGPVGKKIVALHYRAGDYAAPKAGHALHTLEELGLRSKMPAADNAALVDFLRGASDAIPQRLAPLAQALETEGRAMVAEAQTAGLQVHARDDYFRFAHLRPDGMLDNKHLVRDVVQGVLRRKEFGELDEAGVRRMLDARNIAQKMANTGTTLTHAQRVELQKNPFVQWVAVKENIPVQEAAGRMALSKGLTKHLGSFYGSLDMPRRYYDPFWDENVGRVFGEHFQRGYQRIGEARAYGSGEEKLNRLLGQMGDDEAQAAVVENMKAMRGEVLPARGFVEQRILKPLTQLGTLKMGPWSGASNLGQITNMVKVAGLHPTKVAKGIAYGRSAAGQEFAARAGITTNRAIDTMNRPLHEGGWSEWWFDHLTGMRQSEKSNLTKTAGIMRQHIDDVAARYVQDPENFQLRTELMKWRVNPRAVLRQGGISEAQRETAALAAAQYTQFLNIGAHVPAAATRTMPGRFAAKYKTFQLAQARFLVNSTKDDAQRKGIPYAAGSLLGFMTLAGGYGAFLQKLQDIVEGRDPQPESTFWQVMAALHNGGVTPFNVPLAVHRGGAFGGLKMLAPTMMVTPIEAAAQAQGVVERGYPRDADLDYAYRLAMGGMASPTKRLYEKAKEFLP